MKPPEKPSTKKKVDKSRREFLALTVAGAVAAPAAVGSLPGLSKRIFSGTEGVLGSDGVEAAPSIYHEKENPYEKEKQLAKRLFDYRKELSHLRNWENLPDHIKDRFLARVNYINHIDQDILILGSMSIAGQIGAQRKKQLRNIVNQRILDKENDIKSLVYEMTGAPDIGLW